MRPSAALVLSLAFAACKEKPRTAAMVGDQAPVYRATILSGDSVSSADLRGKVVLLNVWATWCAPCREEIPYLQSLYTANKEKGFAVVGVSIDARGSDSDIQAFVKEFGMTYPIWRDPDENIQSLYMALGVPASYLIDRSGTLRYRRLGIIRETDTTFTNALARALAPSRSN